jgi:hypothetical protein
MALRFDRRVEPHANLAAAFIAQLRDAARVARGPHGGKNTPAERAAKTPATGFKLKIKVRQPGKYPGGRGYGGPGRSLPPRNGATMVLISLSQLAEMRCQASRSLLDVARSARPEASAASRR